MPIPNYIDRWSPRRDERAPTPNPATFVLPPVGGAGAGTVRMIATVATDRTAPVEYYFTNTAGGGNSSGWQTSQTYIDTGLVSGNSYAYTVKSRDGHGNETEPSAPATGTAT